MSYPNPFESSTHTQIYRERNRDREADREMETERGREGGLRSLELKKKSHKDQKFMHRKMRRLSVRVLVLRE